MNYPSVIRACVVSFCLLALVNGCVRDEDSSSAADSNDSSGDSNLAAARLEWEMRGALARFENAENKFGPSTTLEQLTANAYWLDLMAELLQKMDLIHAEASSMGIAVTPGIRESLHSRYQRHRTTFLDDVRQVQANVDYQLALDALRSM
ncbi:MAG: hypothetical protein ACKO2L_08660 [Planctomycetaceae bacterium]